MNNQQINELVAEHVLGWKRGDGSITSDPEGPCPDVALKHIWTTDKGRPAEFTLDATTDGNVMLHVIDKMRAKGVDQGGDGYDIESIEWTGTSWRVRFSFCEANGRDYQMPRAVALGALVALGVEV